MEWARNNIKSRHPVTFAREKDLHSGAIQDLYLMTQCRHYILSNSSLHWWAAWLNPSPDKIVIAPEKGWPNSDMLPAIGLNCHELSDGSHPIRRHQAQTFSPNP